MVGRTDHHNGHAQPPTRRFNTSRTSDHGTRFVTQLQLNQRATLPPQDTLRTVATIPNHIRNTKAQCQDTSAQRRGARALLAHGTDVSERSGKRAQIAIRNAFGPGPSANHSPHTISRQNRLLRNSTASPQATVGLAPLHGQAPGKGQISGSEGAELVADGDLRTHGPCWGTLRLRKLLVDALRHPSSPAAAQPRLPPDHFQSFLASPFSRFFCEMLLTS